MKMNKIKMNKINNEIIDELENGHLTKEERKLKIKVRNRNSYKKFEKILKWLQKKRTPKEILWKIHNIIDEMGGYKYRQTSDWASESLVLLMEDIKNEK